MRRQAGTLSHDRIHSLTELQPFCHDIGVTVGGGRSLCKGLVATGRDLYVHALFKGCAKALQEDGSADVLAGARVLETTLALSDGEYDLVCPRCPRCGSYTVDEYRQVIVRYRLDRDGERAEEIIKASEDPIFHRCVACAYGSDLLAWDEHGRSDFLPPPPRRFT